MLASHDGDHLGLSDVPRSRSNHDREKNGKLGEDDVQNDVGKVDAKGQHSSQL